MRKELKLLLALGLGLGVTEVASADPQLYHAQSADPCAVCHSLSSAKAWVDAATGAGSNWLGRNGPAKCYTCHSAGNPYGATDQTLNAFGNDNSLVHMYGVANLPPDLNGAARTIPANYFIRNIAGVDTNNVDCITCHDVHSRTNRPYLAQASTIQQLCIDCHGRTWSGAKAAGNVTALGRSTHPQNVPYTFTGNNGEAFPNAYTYRSDLNAADVTRDFAELQNAAFTSNWTLGAHSRTGADGAAAVQIDCQTCHVVHGGDDYPVEAVSGARAPEAGLLVAAIVGSAPGTTTRTKSPICQACHLGGTDEGETVQPTTQRAPAARDHPIGVRALSYIAIDRKTTAADDDASNRTGEGTGWSRYWGGTAGTGEVPVCVTCHDVHGGLNGTALYRVAAQAYKSGGAPVAQTAANWCYTCHADASPTAHHDSGSLAGARLECEACHGQPGTRGYQAHGDFFTVMIPTSEAISGRVTAGPGGAPLTGVLVVATGFYRYAARTDGNGYYEFPVYSSSNYMVTASRAGFLSGSQSATVTPGAKATVNFALAPRPGAVWGRVTGAGGAPLAGAVVSTTRGGYTATTDGDGNYALLDVPPGSYTLTVTVAGYLVGVQTITVGPGQTKGADAALLEGGTLEGRVIDAGTGERLAGAAVTANPGGHAAAADRDGAFTLALPLGRYRVSASASRHQTSPTQGAEVLAGLTTTVNLALRAGGTHWTDPGATATWNDYQGNLSIQGAAAQAGDEMAAFDPQGVLCGHFVVTAPGTYGEVRVWGDDPGTPEDEGASPGDALTFRLWSAGQGKEFPASAVVVSGFLEWTAGGASKVNLSTTRRVVLPLQAGWNLVSFPVAACWYAEDKPPTVALPTGAVLEKVASIRDLLSGIEGKYTQLRGFDEEGAHSYDPTVPEVFNDLTYLAGGYGYWIKMKEEADLVLEGPPLAEGATLVLASGWNLAGYWGRDCRYVGSEPAARFPPGTTYTPVARVADVVESLGDRLLLLRSFDEAGAHGYDPGISDVLNDLTYLGPGYGTWVKLGASGWLRFGELLPNSCVPDPPALQRVCAMVYGPLCGCDGRTYGNDCEAGNAGVGVVYEGECR